MKKITLFNNHILVKELERKDDSSSFEGLVVPKENMDDEQVSQGTVIKSTTDGIKKGDILMFHKVMPIDVNMQLEGDKEMTTYFFIKEKDIICKIK